MPANDAFIVSRMNKMVFTMAIALLATLPLWSSKIYYRDDLYRVLNGSTETWLTNGRPATWIMQSILSFGQSVSDISPLNLIIGLLALSIASVVFTERLQIRLDGYWAFIPPLFIVLNPFLTQVMLYSYDSLTMLVSISCAMMASQIEGTRRYKSITCCVLLLLLVQTLYQSGLNIYIACIALIIFFRVYHHQPVWQWLLSKVAALLIAVLAYKLFISYLLPVKMDWYTLKHFRLLPFNLESLAVIQTSIKRYSEFFLNAYPAAALVFVVLPIVIALISTLIISSKIRSVQRHASSGKWLLLPAFFIAVLAVPGLSLALAMPLFAPRMLMAWSITLLFFFYVGTLAFPRGIKLLAGSSLILLCYHLVLMLVCFNTVVNDQRYQMSVMNQIKMDFSSFPAQTIDSVAFIGQLNDAPDVRINIRNFPIINPIRMKMLGESEPWIWQAMMWHVNLSLKTVEASDEMRMIKPREYQSQGPDYDAFKDNNVLVIDFRKSGGVVTKYIP